MHDEMKPMMSKPVDDHEGEMARSELYRAAKYSMKLFQMIDENQDLEGWVQSKISKAADYLDSVYHYMEYQMKFGGGAPASTIDDITGEAGEEVTDTVDEKDDEELEIKEGLTYEEKLQALLEGKVKKMVKGKKAEDEKMDEATGFRASDKKKGKVEKSEKKQYFVKLEKEGKTKGMTMVADEGETESDVRDRAKRDNRGWTVASVRAKDTGSGEEVNESKKKKPDDDNDGVPNWADKKPGEDDNADKKTSGKKGMSAKQAKYFGKKNESVVAEKAVSKAQQKFMGMVHAAKKGEKPASKEVAKAAKGMSGKEAEKFASTKHKGLPEKKEKKDESLVRSIVKKVIAEKKSGKDKESCSSTMKQEAIKKEPVKKDKVEKKEVMKESTDLSRLKALSGLK